MKETEKYFFGKINKINKLLAILTEIKNKGYKLFKKK